VTTPVSRPCSNRSLWLLFVPLFAWSAQSRAQDQFVLVDQTYTATTQNTTMSQYTIAPKSGVPSSLKAPIDYTMGSVYVRYEVLEKPSDKATLWGICFETGSVLTCMPTPPSYAVPGVYTYSAAFSKFWQFSMFDWTKPIDKVLTTLKDGNMAAVQGDASFYPTKVHVTLTVVAPGKTFVDPGDEDAGPPSKPSAPMPAAGSGSGAAGRATSPASGAGRGGQSTAPGSAGTNAFDAGPPKAGSAGIGGAGKAGTTTNASTAAGNQAGDINDYVDPGSSCAAVGGQRHSPLSAAALAFGLLLHWRRRRRARLVLR
jgi:hypothetical protein